MMKRFFQLMATLFLGASIGAAVTHFEDTKKLVFLNKAQVKDIQPTSSIKQLEQGSLGLLAEEKSQKIEANSIAQRELQLQRIIDALVKSKQGSEPAKAVSTEMLTMISSLRDELKIVKKQLAETNRDMAEANFRLDTHSESFKPLKVESDKIYSLDSDYNKAPGALNTGLLPPK